MTNLLPFTLTDMLNEINREIRLRQRVYPRWIADGKLSQSRADSQIAVMNAIADIIELAIAEPDPAEEKQPLQCQVAQDVMMRAASGLAKYGTTMDRTDLTREQWLQHLYEELLDAAVYTKKLINGE